MRKIKNNRLWLLPVVALLVLALTFGVTAAAEETANDNPLLMTVGGIEIYKGDVEDIAVQLNAYGILSSPDDYIDALNYMLYYNVAPGLLTAGQEKELLGDSYDMLSDYYAESFRQEVQFYADTLVGEDASEEEKQNAYEVALDLYSMYGLTEESYVQDGLLGDAFDVYTQNLGIEISDEEVQAEYDAEVAAQKEFFTDNLFMYEYYSMYGYELYYVPAGYRGIQHILLGVEQELLDAYNNAEDEEAKAAAAQAILDSVKETTDTIYAALENGTPFEELIAQYNTDPGMSGDNLTNGYKVHKESITYVQEFTDGAFSDRMTEPGCVSDPVLTSYGVHILHYLKDIPEGAAEMTDAVREKLRQSIRETEIIIEIGRRLNALGIVYTDDYDTVIGALNLTDAQ